MRNMSKCLFKDDGIFPEMLKKWLPFKTYNIKRGRVYNFVLSKKTYADLSILTYVARFLILMYLILSVFLEYLSSYEIRYYSFLTTLS